MKKSTTEAMLWAGASMLMILGAVIGLMSGNMDSVQVQDVTRSLALLLPVSFVVTLLALAIHRPLGRIFPAAIFLYFLYFDLHNLFQRFGFENVLYFTFIMLCLLALYVGLRYVDGLRASLYTFVAATAMVIVPLFSIAPSLFYDPPPGIDANFENEIDAAVKAHKGRTSDLPDIIYVIPDRYASQSTLRTEYGFDNKAFYEELRKRGFFVSEKAWANYPKTFQSMASTFNSGYLQGFTKAYGPNSSDQRPIYEKIETNIVQEYLRKLGYLFHNYGNWWKPTRINKWAEVNYQGYPPDSLQNLSEFESALWRKTPTTKIVRLFTDVDDKIECRRIKRKFQRLRKVGNQKKPVFVLAHFVVPHDPIYINATGQCLPKRLVYISTKGTPWKTFKAGYIEYLKYFNSTILEIIDEQLRRRGPTGRKLLFVIQSDEGPLPKSMRDRLEHYDFSRLSHRELKMKTGTINALLLPKGMRRVQPKLTTPVNNWRFIINALTGSNIKLLPNKVFIFPNKKDIFNFCDVTNAVTKPDVAAPPCTKWQGKTFSP